MASTDAAADSSRLNLQWEWVKIDDDTVKHHGPSIYADPKCAQSGIPAYFSSSSSLSLCLEVELFEAAFDVDMFQVWYGIALGILFLCITADRRPLAVQLAVGVMI
jgi:hypothetical protein